MTSHGFAHLNAAGAAIPLPFAQDAVFAHMREEARVGPHWAASAAADALDGTKAAAAQLFDAPGPANIAFGETATRLWASALGAMPLQAGARLLVARCEWGGNVLNALKMARAVGATVEVVPSDAAGRMDVGALAAMLDERVAAICLPAASSGLGVWQPVLAVGKLPRPERCLLFVDAAQAAGRAPVGLDLWNADVVTAPARKWLRGPRGQAAMALSDRALSVLGDPPLLDQAGSPWTGRERWATREDAARFEAYEFSAAGRLGFRQALLAACEELPAIETHIRDTLGWMSEQLDDIPGVTVFEDSAADAAFLTFACAHEEPAATVARLRRSGVAVATVGLGYARLDFEARGLTEVCRVSPHAYTGYGELLQFLAVLAGGTWPGGDWDSGTAWKSAKEQTGHGFGH